jgi:hypothetical protein
LVINPNFNKKNEISTLVKSGIGYTQGEIFTSKDCGTNKTQPICGTNKIGSVNLWQGLILSLVPQTTILFAVDSTNLQTS